MSIEQHVISLTAKDGVSRTFTAIGGNAQKMGTQVEKSASAGSKALTAMGQNASKIGAGLGALTVLATKAYADAQASQQRLKSSIEATDHSYLEFSDTINTVSKRALQLGFDDEDLADSIAQLTDVTHDANQAIEDTSIVMDVARGRHISLAQATDIVAAAEQGRIGALRRMGIAIDANATSEQALDALRTQYAGRAEEFASTDAARWERMQNSAENALESIGSHISSIAVPLLGLTAAWSLFGGAVSGAGGAIAGIAAPAAEGGAGLLTLAGGVEALGAAALVATPLVIGLYLALDQKRLMSDFEYQAAQGAQALEHWGLTGQAYAENLVTQLQVTNREMLNATQTGTESLHNIRDMVLSLDNLHVEALMGAIGAQGLKIEEINTNAWSQDDINWFAQSVRQLYEDEQSLYDQRRMNQHSDARIIDPRELGQHPDTTTTPAPTGVDSGWDAMAQANMDVANAQRMEAAAADYQAERLDALLAKIKEVAPALELIPSNFAEKLKMTGAFGSVIADVDALTKGTASLATGIEVVISGTQALSSQMGGLNDWARDLINVAGEYGKIDELLAKGYISQQEYNDAQEAGNRIFRDNNSIQQNLLTIQAKQAPVLADLADEQRRYIDHLAELPPLQEAAALGFMDTAEAAKAQSAVALAASAAMGELGDTGEETATRMIAGAVAADPYLESMLESIGLIARDHEGNIKVNFPEGESVQAAVDNLTASIGIMTDALFGIPPHMHTDVDASGLDDTWEISNYIAYLQSIPSYVSTVVETIYVQGAAGPGRGIGNGMQLGGVAHAQSGTVSRSPMTLVGESGPELVSLPYGSYVAPAAGTRAGRRGEMSGITISNCPITIVANNPKQFGEAIRAYALGGRT